MKTLRENLKVVVACVLTAAVVASAPAIGHGVRHALFAHDSKKLGGKPRSAYAATSRSAFPQSINGVAFRKECDDDELGVMVRNGRGKLIDRRFTFFVPGPTEAYGQIRDDGSIRNASSNVTGVEHDAKSGFYCIQFSTVIGQAELESAVLSLHHGA